MQQSLSPSANGHLLGAAVAALPASPSTGAGAAPAARRPRRIRCSVLQLDPRQVGRLREIAESLERRIPEARNNGWFGEVEGLEVSLAGARPKPNTADRAASGPVLLGLPTFRTDELL